MGYDMCFSFITSDDVVLLFDYNDSPWISSTIHSRNGRWTKSAIYIFWAEKEWKGNIIEVMASHGFVPSVTMLSQIELTIVQVALNAF